MEAMKEYVAHLDNKKRITLRGVAYQYYNVKEYGNGCIILEPRELAVPESISARTLAPASPRTRPIGPASCYG